MNNVKFSVIICHLKYEDVLEQWMEVLSGALSKSNCDAVHHFTSLNFNHCYATSNSYILENSKLAKGVFSEYAEQFIVNIDLAKGQYITAVCKNISSEVGKNIGFMRKIISTTKASFYPGHLNGLASERLSFRINLTLAASELQYSLFQIAEFIKTMPNN